MLNCVLCHFLHVLFYYYSVIRFGNELRKKMVCFFTSCICINARKDMCTQHTNAHASTHVYNHTCTYTRTKKNLIFHTPALLPEHQDSLRVPEDCVHKRNYRSSGNTSWPTLCKHRLKNTTYIMITHFFVLFLFL